MQGLLVFGRTGQVARELAALAPDATFLGRDRADLTDPAACAALIRAARPRAVINAAAYTAVDRAETDPDTARLVNADAPAAMARACADLASRSCTSRPITSLTDRATSRGPRMPRPRPWASMARPSWPESRAWPPRAEPGRDADLLGVLRPRREFRQDDAAPWRGTRPPDRGGRPDRGADACRRHRGRLPADDPRDARRPDTTGGIYHFAGTPDASWADFARQIMAQAGLAAQVADIPSSDYPTPAARPLNSRLDCGRIARDFGIARPDWRAGLTRVLDQLKDKA